MPIYLTIRSDTVSFEKFGVPSLQLLRVRGVVPHKITLRIKKTNINLHLYLCIYTVNYKKRNQSVFITFLDASKAFDRIYHCVLFEKLVIKYVIIFFYSQQNMM